MRANELIGLQEFQELLNTPELPSLGPEIRSSREDLAALETRLHALGQNVKLTSPAAKLVRSLVLLWHDYLDESHALSQDIPTPDGSFLHGIMHRREPDYDNAKYWFHRVGQHPSFPEIARRTAVLLENVKSSSLENALLSGGAWNACAFVAAVEQATKRQDEKQIDLWQRIQEIEFRVLLETFLAANGRA